jgi:hypothetical protein
MKLEPHEQWSDHDPDQLEFWTTTERRERVIDWIVAGILVFGGAALVIAIGYLFI